MKQSDRTMMALCRLVLEDGQWSPVGVNTDLTSQHRATEDGPVIHATLLADVEGTRVTGWRAPTFHVQEVLEDGSLEPLDLSDAAEALDAMNMDEQARLAGAVGINRALLKKRSSGGGSQALTEEVRAAALDSAADLIVAALRGGRVAGVKVFAS